MGVPGAPDVPTNVWRNPGHRQHIYNETSQDSIVSRFAKISFRWERSSSIIYICLKKFCEMLFMYLHLCETFHFQSCTYVIESMGLDTG